MSENDGSVGDLADGFNHLQRKRERERERRAELGKAFDELELSVRNVEASDSRTRDHFDHGGPPSDQAAGMTRLLLVQRATSAIKALHSENMQLQRAFHDGPMQADYMHASSATHSGWFHQVEGSYHNQAHPQYHYPPPAFAPIPPSRSMRPRGWSDDAYQSDNGEQWPNDKQHHVTQSHQDINRTF
jgi:hypothetical protein